jgi:hypothetical protein
LLVLAIARQERGAGITACSDKQKKRPTANLIAGNTGRAQYSQAAKKHPVPFLSRGMTAKGRFETVAMQQGERRVLRVKRTLNSCFLCVDQLLKSAISSHWRFPNSRSRLPAKSYIAGSDARDHEQDRDAQPHFVDLGSL